jgi:hypothetical protein
MIATERVHFASEVLLPKAGGEVTGEAVRQYALAVGPRYFLATKREKGRLLDEFCAVTGRHRKAAIRLFRRGETERKGPRGRPREYEGPVVDALRRVWEASDCTCAKHLTPIMGEYVTQMEVHGEIALESEVRAKLLKMSAATMDRLLRPYRRGGLRRPYTHRKSSTALKALIPIKTFGEWGEARVGSMQSDLVAHCGESTEGFYICTLNSVDVAIGWEELEAVWGKGRERVGGALQHIRRRMPFEMRELHTDNGAEFINDVVYPWCKREGIALTRGRPYKKNDQAYIEQKNWQVPRRFIGYDRYSTKAAYEQMKRLYEPIRLYVNFFQPISKLLSKERDGAKVTKRYDRPRTPYQRLLETDALDQTKRDELARCYAGLSPAKLLARIHAELDALWKLADKPNKVMGT